MAGTYNPLSIDEYLRERLMPVEGAIPHVQGIEMYGNPIPAGTVGGDKGERRQLESVMHEHCLQPAKGICNALLEYARKRDDRLRQIGEEDRIDDKTVFIIKRN
jgi:hypothetical protein